MESAPRAVMAAGNVRYDIPVGGAVLQQAGVSDTWASPYIWQQDGGPLWHKARCWHLACKGSCRVDEQGGWGGGWAEVLGGGRRMRNRWQERQVADISTCLVLWSNEETVCQREENALKARKKWKWSQSLILSSLFSFSFSLPFLLLFLLNFLRAISSPFLFPLFFILFLSAATFLFFCFLLFTLSTPFLPQFCFSYFTLFSYFSSSFFHLLFFIDFSRFLFPLTLVSFFPSYFPLPILFLYPLVLVS